MTPAGKSHYDDLANLLAGSLCSHLDATIKDMSYLSPEHNRGVSQSPIVRDWIWTLHNNGRLAEICATLILHHRNKVADLQESQPKETPAPIVTKDQKCDNCRFSRGTNYSIHGNHAPPLSCNYSPKPLGKEINDWCGKWEEIEDRT